MPKTLEFKIKVATSATKAPDDQTMLKRVVESWFDIDWNELKTKGTLRGRTLSIDISVKK